MRDKDIKHPLMFKIKMYKIIMIEIQNTKKRRHRQTDRQTQCFNDKQGKNKLHVDYNRKIQNTKTQTNTLTNRQTNALIH